MSTQPQEEPTTTAPEGDGEPLEVVARFDPGEPADAPQGTVAQAGEAPRAFHGWLELMAIVEGLLERRRGRRDGG